MSFKIFACILLYLRTSTGFRPSWSNPISSRSCRYATPPTTEAEEIGSSLSHVTRRELLVGMLAQALLYLPVGSEASAFDTSSPDSAQIISLLDSLGPAVGDCKRIILCRHGQTDYNKRNIVQGRHLNPTLNEVGVSQANLLASTLSPINVCAVYSGPLLRAKQTADAVMSKQLHKGTRRVVSDSLTEIDLGNAEGQPQAAGALILAKDYLSWAQGDLKVRVGETGESGVEVRTRIRDSITTLLNSCTKYKSHWIVGVTHSSFVKATLAHVLDEPLQKIRSLGQANCAVNIIEWNTKSSKFHALVINNVRV